VQDPFTRVRLIKTPEELRLVHRCARIADQVLKRIKEVMRPGITERDVVAEAEYVARRLGCEGTSVLISRGTLMAQPMPQDTVLQAGDILQFSIEPEGPGGIWVQIVRMVALGEPSQDWQRLIDAGVEGEKRGAALLRDDCHASEVAKAMSALLPGKCLW
jgi:Xaa-Pro aminopeptidase